MYIFSCKVKIAFKYINNNTIIKIKIKIITGFQQVTWFGTKAQRLGEFKWLLILYLRLDKCYKIIFRSWNDTVKNLEIQSL